MRGACSTLHPWHPLQMQPESSREPLPGSPGERPALLESKEVLEVLVPSDALRRCWDTNPACTVLCLGLTCASASSGIRGHRTAFAPALPCAKHERCDSEAQTWKLCSSDPGLQTEIPPDPRRAKSVCFGHFDKNFSICSKTFCSCLSLFIYYMLFSLLCLYFNSFSHLLFWDSYTETILFMSALNLSLRLQAENLL